ncbi:restriction endonuclease subunit S [Vagococcus lutrae]|uniref:restriction endonuclease subunit S n=1 Tax=Vagococcus lutrae TaxID=81947 RepID=UPI0023A930E3|nr:restriction endonuclease subunit S [Vagococcus lutrae]WEB81029.1 restriction endonuclease subunit S [Vagococcus lutrae]
MKYVKDWGQLDLTSKILSDISGFAGERVNIAELTLDNYISTENMLPNKEGITKAAKLPTGKTTSGYKKGDILVSNIRPYFKKIWYAKEDGGCSNDVLVIRANHETDSKYLYYVLANDKFFDYNTATSKGTKMPRGDKTAIMRYEVPDYPIEIQREIAKTLSILDDKIAENKKINHHLVA